MRGARKLRTFTINKVSSGCALNEAMHAAVFGAKMGAERGTVVDGGGCHHGGALAANKAH